MATTPSTQNSIVVVLLLKKNHENICGILAAIEHKFSVVSVAETWKRSSDCSELKLPGYQFVSNHRNDRSESGYSHQDSSLKVLKEHNSHDTSFFESPFVGICLNNVKNVVVGVIYRSPSENKFTLLEKFDKLFSKLNRNEKICYISVDFNF